MIILLSCFVIRFCQDDFNRLDRGVAFCNKRNGRLSFFLAVGTTPMERGMAAPAAATVSDGI